MRFYGIDIHGLFTGELPPRYCLALIEHLPLESAFKSRALCEGGVSDFGWDRNTFILAEMLDAIQSMHTSFIRSKVKNPRSVKQPEPYRRPGATKENEKKYNPFANALDDELPDPSEDRELYGESGQKTFAIPSAILARSSSTEGKGAPFKVS
ncbi:hypothetical protein H340_01384 [Streptomyces mobaraensis NBRC 13819 = DSM 40847]|uniref:Uncharacterized protein n=2 Tax=Streptomyces TaxID=1883 RepID=M3CEG6_STRM1|nr:hypothetical protein H340_01384 [Streptomyces mobaraensis NBRC 13819 = DSM 40847]